MHIEDNLRAGMTPKEARRQAAIQLGGVEQTRQAYRERGTLPWLEGLVQDIRYGLRMMARNPGFTAVAVITLAIGIGTTTTVFSWIDAVLVRPLPGVADPSRLVALESLTPGGEMVPNSYPDYRDFRDHLKLFDGIAVTRPAPFSVGQEDHAERVWGELVSGNFFAVLGVAPQIGRVFLPSEYGDKPGAFPIAVISDRYWRSHFHADPEIAGKTIRVNQHELTIVGVAPPGFQGSMPATAFDLWVPYMEQSVLNGVSERMALLNRQNRNMLSIARLGRGVTIDQARNELAALATYMSVANADVSQGMSATLLPLWKSPHGPQALLAAPLKILMGISVLVLLIVCANVANLLLAKAASREKEFSTRLALGAARGRLTRQVLTESLMLAVAGGAGRHCHDRMDEPLAQISAPSRTAHSGTRSQMERPCPALRSGAVRGHRAARGRRARSPSAPPEPQPAPQRGRTRRQQRCALQSSALAAGRLARSRSRSLRSSEPDSSPRVFAPPARSSPASIPTTSWSRSSISPPAATTSSSAKHSAGACRKKWSRLREWSTQPTPTASR